MSEDQQPQKLTTARENAVTVMIDTRRGQARVVSDATAMRELAEAARDAQARSEDQVLVFAGT